MGLDAVELVMEVEEAFDITILDRHAEKILTIGDLYRHVLAKLDGQIRDTPGCLSAAAFYRLRRQLMNLFRTERRRIRPASVLAGLIPAKKRREQWRRLEDGLGWELPELMRPGWVKLASFGLLITWAATIIFAWGWETGFALEAAGPALGLLLIGGFLLGVNAYLLTKPLATRFPSPDVRGLIAMILDANASIRSMRPQGWDPQEVWQRLISIVAEQTGVASDQLTESTSFVYDLGLG